MNVSCPPPIEHFSSPSLDNNVFLSVAFSIRLFPLILPHHLSYKAERPPPLLCQTTPTVLAAPVLVPVAVASLEENWVQLSVYISEMGKKKHFIIYSQAIAVVYMSHPHVTDQRPNIDVRGGVVAKMVRACINRGNGKLHLHSTECSTWRHSRQRFMIMLQSLWSKVSAMPNSNPPRILCAPVPSPYLLPFVSG